MSQPTHRPETIDVHTHIYPEPYLRHLESRTEIPRVIRRGDERIFVIFPQEVATGSQGGRPMGAEFWDVGEKLAYMDRNGIDRSVVSLGNPWLNPLPTPAGDALAAAVNAELAALGDRSGSRLAGLGALPASSVEVAVAGLQAVAATPGLVGAGAGPKIAGLAFDNPQLKPFWAELERLDLPLFVHPENGLATAEMQGYGHALPIGAAFPMETTVAAARLIFGGVLERHPGLKILLAHGGGTLPYLAGRLDVVWRTDPAVRARLPQPPSSYLRRLYFDGLLYSGPALQALVRLAGPERVLFGTDHPFNVADPQGNLQAVRAEFGSAETARQVLGGNARALFGL